MKKTIKNVIFAIVLGISFFGCSNSIVDESNFQQNFENACEQSDSQIHENSRCIWGGEGPDTGGGDVIPGNTSILTGGGN